MECFFEADLNVSVVRLYSSELLGARVKVTNSWMDSRGGSSNGCEQISECAVTRFKTETVCNYISLKPFDSVLLNFDKDEPVASTSLAGN